MRFNCPPSDSDPVSEMAIVDTFTRLIFGDEAEFSLRELSIIQAFRSVDANVLMDSYGEMGEYLRNLGVSEMIHLVSRIRQHLEEQALAALCDMAQGDHRDGKSARRRHGR